MPKAKDKRKLISLAEKLLKIKDTESEIGQARFLKLMDEVDQVVYSIYGLNEDEVDLDLAA